MTRVENQFEGIFDRFFLLCEFLPGGSLTMTMMSAFIPDYPKNEGTDHQETQAEKDKIF
jgi:hypothetical protein